MANVIAHIDIGRSEMASHMVVKEATGFLACAEKDLMSTVSLVDAVQCLAILLSKQLSLTTVSAAVQKVQAELVATNRVLDKLEKRYSCYYFCGDRVCADNSFIACRVPKLCEVVKRAYGEVDAMRLSRNKMGYAEETFGAVHSPRQPLAVKEPAVLGVPSDVLGDRIRITP
jgi:hypothetical protein